METTKAKTWTKDGRHEKFWWTLSVLTIMLIISLFFTGKVQAADFSTALSKTMAEIPVGADVAGMGNANTASPDFSSSNPAIIGVEGTEKFVAGATATYGHLSFKKGTRINLYSVSASAQLPVGVIQITGTDARSNRAEIEGEKLQFSSMPSVGLQYGLPVGKSFLLQDDSLYLGLSCDYSQSKMNVSADSDVFMIKSKGYLLGAGILYRFGKVVNLGASYEHAWDKSDDFYRGIFETSEKSEAETVRLGLSAQVTSMTLLAVDYQHLYLEGEQADQYFAGVEQYLVKDLLAVYAGYANGGATVGLGVYLKHGGLNVAYLNRTFRQLDEFLGKSEVVMVSFYGTF